MTVSKMATKMARVVLLTLMMTMLTVIMKVVTDDHCNKEYMMRTMV